MPPDAKTAVIGVPHTIKKEYLQNVVYSSLRLRRDNKEGYSKRVNGKPDGKSQR